MSTARPKDDPGWRPPVPLEQTVGAYDPVTVGFVARHLIHDHMEQNIRESQLRTYEGARLADFTLTVVSPADVEALGGYQHAINTVVARHPITGYTPKELKRYNAGDPVVHVYFSADSKLLPIRIETRLKFGTVTAELKKID